MLRRKYTGRAFILAALFALCAMLIPTQAANAALPKKVNVNNAYSVASCSFTKTKVDLVAGTVTYRVTAAARPTGFNAFRNVVTYMECSIVDPAFTYYVDWGYNVGKTTINQNRTVTVPISEVGFFCGYSYTEQKSGNVDVHDFDCITAP